MTEQEKKPWNLSDALALEEEVHDWDDILGSKLVSYAKDTNAAKKAGQWDLARKLEKEWDEWSLVERNGYSRADETELGRSLLAYVRERRNRLEEDSPAHRKIEERKARELPLWDSEIEKLWSDLSERILEARDAGDQKLLKKLLQESEELGRTRTSGYGRTSSTKLGQEILEKIRKESDS